MMKMGNILLDGYCLVFLILVWDFDPTMANSYAMQTEEMTLFPEIGNNVTLECVISWQDDSDFSLVTHIPQWAKSQSGMGIVIYEKGLVKKNQITQTGRYHSSIKSTGSNSLSYNLTITDIQPEDGGSYTCGVATQEGVEKTLSHKVSISVPLESLAMETSSNPSYKFDILETPGDDVFFDTTKVGYAMCTAEGGTHPIKLKIVIGNKEKELEEVSLSANKEWIGNVTGLQKLHVTTVVTTTVRVTSSDNGQTLKCIGSVQGQSDVNTYGTVKTLNKKEKLPPKDEMTISSGSSTTFNVYHIFIIGIVCIIAAM